MGKRNKKEIIADIYNDQELLVADGFDDAIIGVDEISYRVVYSVKKCIKILVGKFGIDDEDEAMEYFEFNVSGAYMGEKTPIWCYDIF